jgi:capsular exopolysaccharide synthesis family protein
MEEIRQAVERARAGRDAGREQHNPARTPISPQGPKLGAASGYQSHAEIQEVALNSAYLQSNRIISHIVTDPLARPFDMLRTQILQSMDSKSTKILAVTSPTPGCGKTVTAANLAFSIARQPERSVLLVDLDFQKPKVATSLGLECDDGVLSVLDGRTMLPNAIIHACVGNQRLMVLPTTSTTGSSELMTSRAMAAMFQDLRKDYASQIVIVDLPPILSSDDVISILPQVDCVLLVVAVGISTVSEIEQCNRHLQSAEVVRIVLNKVPHEGAPYYYY